jgi:hypothetical protein
MPQGTNEEKAVAETSDFFSLNQNTSLSWLNMKE